VGLLAYHAASNEITGKATYYHGLGRGSTAEPVTRAESPKKFGVTINLLWGWSVLALTASVATLLISSKLDDTLAEPF
jgi:hypothetical protein